MENNLIVSEHNTVDKELDELANIFLEDLQRGGYDCKEGDLIGIGLQGEDFV